MPAPAGVFLERHSARTKQLVIELAINAVMAAQGMDKQAVFALQAQRREDVGDTGFPAPTSGVQLDATGSPVRVSFSLLFVSGNRKMAIPST